MYLSCLLINVGDNPDRPRPGRLWLRNMYRVHQRLCMAFPSTERVSADPEFLMPFIPKAFGDVKIARSHAQGFLFRVDSLRGNRAMIIVQSAREPDWNYAFHNAEHFLAGPPLCRPFEDSKHFKTNDPLHFRLLANPVRKVSKKSLGIDGKPLNQKWLGKEVPVPMADLEKWLLRRAEPGWSPPKNKKESGQKQPPPGFKIESISNIHSGFVNISKGRDDEHGKATRRRSALYQGILRVTNPEHFRATLNRGIGPGKAFGFGLLSVARA